MSLYREMLAAVPAIRPDVTIIHAQRADRAGNVLLDGIVGVQKQAVLAAKRAIVTVEEIVDELDAPGLECGRTAVLDDYCDRRGPRWCLPVIRAGLLSPRQLVLHGMGRDLPRPGTVRCLDQ